MPIIPEIVTEIITTLAGHYGATVEETLTAYTLDIGTVRAEAHALYCRTHQLLTEDA